MLVALRNVDDSGCCFIQQILLAALRNVDSGYCGFVHSVCVPQWCSEEVMAYVNVAEWGPEQVSDWIRGIEK